MPVSTRLPELTLAVQDLPRLGTFYEQVLGLQVHERAVKRVVFGAECPFLVLEEAGSGRSAQPATGLFHVAFVFPSSATLANAAARLLTNGYGLQGAADHGVSEALYLADPEGNGIELYRDRGRDEWPWRDGILDMGTEPLDLHSLMIGADPAAPLSPDLRIGHIHLRVGAVAEAERFYQEGLGLARMQRWRGDASFLSADGYHHHIGVNTWTSSGLPQPAAGAPGLTSFTWAVIASELKAIAAGLTRLDWPFTLQEGTLRTREPSGAELVVCSV